MSLWTKTKELLSETSNDETLLWEGIQVKINRRRGLRSLCLRFDSVGVARLTCSPRVPLQSIHRFLEQRRSWIEQQNLKMQKWAPWQKRCGNEGETYLYLGDHLKLKDAVTALRKPFVAVTPAEAPHLYYYWPENMLSLRHHLRSKVYAGIESFMEQRAEEVFLERTEVISNLTGLRPKLIRFRSQKSRWGSCSAGGHVSLNRRLIGAPLWVIDSVIVHEFAHLVHMNHSQAFWNIVEEYSPDHPAADLWLNENQFKLLPG